MLSAYDRLLTTSLLLTHNYPYCDQRHHQIWYRFHQVIESSYVYVHIQQAKVEYLVLYHCHVQNEDAQDL